MKTNKKTYTITLYFASNLNYTYTIMAFNQLDALKALQNVAGFQEILEEEIIHIHFEK